MSDGTNPPSHPQPEPAPGSGGYGFPSGPPAQDGYGYPPASGGYGYPQSGQQPNPYQQDTGGGQWPPAQPGSPSVALRDPSDEPDWAAMADRSAAERRRKRLWMLGGGVTVLALLAGGGTFFLLGSGDDGAEGDARPTASGSPSPSEPTPDKSTPAAYTATVAGDDTLLRNSYGKVGIRLGPDLRIDPLGKRFQVIGKGNGNSWGQSAEPVVDVTKSFTLTARAYNSAAKGSRIVMSQGDGESFSFELGVNEVKGKQAWIFRVQTGDKGAAATTRTVTAEGLDMVKTPTLLMATYDAEKKAIALYVNGKKADETQVPPIWEGPGPLQLGRSKHHNIWTGPWQGALHNIKIYNMAFTAEQAAGYKAGKLDPAPKPTHGWLLT
ncbi:LamG-like jellyroll fold domain-containing protein [Streptomyces sp. NPDC090131]|uniref:LamG-like jellyroll fold domain-containing protein n=1 Tax=Streptomyces sp. NPDC090131 TaxID=3365954 RepID=UPI0037FDAA17